MQPYEDPPPPYPGLLYDSTGPKIEHQPMTVYQPALPGGNPYNGGYVPVVQPMRTTTAVVTARAIPVGHRSVHCVCPYCHQNVATQVEHLSRCIPCCVMPFCIPSCQDINHICPSCGNVIGRRKML